ncbi:MAG: hypothetical protein ACFE85_10865 [Candidatus Hodarchaeota archaeon]
MSIVSSLKRKDLAITMFIDWDKYKNMFYNNIYLDDYKIVIKMPLIQRKKSKKDIKIKKFDLTKYTYLCSYQ